VSYPTSWNSFGAAPAPPNSGVTKSQTYYWRVLASNLCLAGATISDHTGVAADPTYPAQFTYIGTPPWFHTEKNNIGAKNSMSLIGSPPAAAASNFQTSYSAISGTGMTNIISDKSWLLKSYGDWSVPKSSYNYFWSKKGAGAATITSLPNPLGETYNWGPGSLTFSSATTLNVNTASVIFVSGDLTINGNLTFNNPTGPGVVFIVNGNITVGSSVTQINGFYIANGTFSDGTGSNALLVNGAIIAHGGVNFQRDLGAGVGKNDDTPAEKIIFQPRYLVDFADLLGAPTYSWKEVAP
jgi:hypothetical protein